MFEKTFENSRKEITKMRLNFPRKVFQEKNQECNIRTKIKVVKKSKKRKRNPIKEVKRGIKK